MQANTDRCRDGLQFSRHVHRLFQLIVGVLVSVCVVSVDVHGKLECSMDLSRFVHLSECDEEEKMIARKWCEEEDKRNESTLFSVTVNTDTPTDNTYKRPVTSIP